MSIPPAEREQQSTPPGSLPVVILACQVMQAMLPEDLPYEVTYLDYGLHRVPANLTGTLQEAIDKIETPSLVVLGYGLCGNGLKGIKARQHTLLVPRVDDCIALLLGSYRDYMREMATEPGTYWLSKGWLESGSHPLKEYQEYEPKYGAKEAMWLMDQQYQHYKRLILVAHEQDDLETYRPQAQEVARFCERWGMHYEERLGSDRYVRRLLQVVEDLDTADGDFLLVPPGGEVSQFDFWR